MGRCCHNAAVDGGDFDIENFYVGYDSSNIFMHIDSVTADELAAISRSSQYDEPDLAIYFMQPNAVNFNEVETNFHLLRQSDTWFPSQIHGCY